MRALFKRKKIIIFVALSVWALGAAYLILVTPLYKSEASVVIRFDANAIPSTNMARDTSPIITAQNDRHETVLANADILSSPDLITEVINAIGLDKMYPDAVEDPPRLGTPLDEGIRLFGKRLSVEPGQQGDVIAVAFEHRNPALAQATLRRMIEGYMRREGEIFSSSDMAFQQQQLEQTRQRLAADQDALQKFKDDAGITSFDDQVVAAIKQRADLATSLQSAQVAYGQASQRTDLLTALLAKVPASVVNSASGEKYHAQDDAENRLAELRLKERQMLTTYNATSPLVQQLRASIATAAADSQRLRGGVAGRESTAPNIVYQNIQTDLIRATAEAQAYKNSITVLTGQLAELDRGLQAREQQHGTLNDLTRAVQVHESAYRAIAAHLDDARVAANRNRGQLSHAAIITEPTLPYKASRPRYVIMAIATVIAGLLAGMGLAVALEFLDDKFIDSDQVEGRLGIPVLATFGEAD